MGGSCCKVSVSFGILVRVDPGVKASVVITGSRILSLA